MKRELLQEIERQLRQEDFGKNWDGEYQDALPVIERFFSAKGFNTEFLSDWESPSRTSELVARRDSLVVRVPWHPDYNGRSLVDLEAVEIHSELAAVSR